jgi:type II secretory pathway component PulF
MKILSVGDEMFHLDGLMDRKTDIQAGMTRLIVFFEIIIIIIIATIIITIISLYLCPFKNFKLTTKIRNKYVC